MRPKAQSDPPAGRRISRHGARWHTSTFMTRSPLAPAQPMHLRKRDPKAVNPEPGQVASVKKTTSREDIMTLNGAYRSWVRLDAVRSTIRWFTYKFWTCISHHLSHFATVFIERRAKGSNATGCIISRFTNKHDMDYKGFVKARRSGPRLAPRGAHCIQSVTRGP